MAPKDTSGITSRRCADAARRAFAWRLATATPVLSPPGLSRLCADAVCLEEVRCGMEARNGDARAAVVLGDCSLGTLCPRVT